MFTGSLISRRRYVAQSIPRARSAHCEKAARVQVRNVEVRLAETSVPRWSFSFHNYGTPDGA